jgi:Flp pilus assembly protein TadD
LRAILFAASLAALSVATAAPQRTAPPPRTQLDNLFGQLSKAGSEEEAKPIEDQILGLFLQSGSPSVDLLMTRAAGALGSGDTGTARRILDSVTAIAPRYAEGWHQRGKLQAIAGDDEGAIVSLGKAVSLNPRQFAAMTELAGILVEYGDKRDALGLFRKALAIDKHLPDAEHEMQQLSREVEGEKI